MPKWGYSSLRLDDVGIAKASGRDLRISPKAAREICRTIRGMEIEAARALLEDVVKKKRPIAYRRYKKEVPHRRGVPGWYSGRYPVKAAQELLKVLNSLEGNAQDLGFDVERLKIIHAVAHKGRLIKSYIPRAFGRSSPRFDVLCHVELAVEEMR